MAILVTGANGFVGKALCHFLVEQGESVRAATRNVQGSGVSGTACAVGNIGPHTDWSVALNDVDCVVHLAARVHQLQERGTDARQQYFAVNTQGTLRLAQQAAQHGARRFVFLSSVKVNGEMTQPGVPFRASDTPAPVDAYGESKRAAEQGLFEISRGTGMEVVIVRCPLVYGPGVKANFARMMLWLARGVPLPLGAVVDNGRSLVGLDNLTDLLYRTVHHPAAAGQVVMAADGEDLSTALLLHKLARAMGVTPRLVRVPVFALRWGAMLLGQEAQAQRLLGNLQIDIQPTQTLLGWKAPYSVDEGFQRMLRNNASVCESK